MSVPTFSAEQVAYLLETARKNDPASLTITAPTLQGPFPGNSNSLGLFSTYGPRAGRFSALVRPSSLASLLTLNKSVYHQELLEIMTGVTASAGTNATGFCGNPPTVGQGKVCEQRYNWGKYYIKTELTAVPEVGTLRSRFEIPGEILNAPPESRNPLIPDVMYRMENTRSQLQYELWRIGVDAERQLDQVLVTGDNSKASTSTKLGFISEPSGLDLMIKTGYTDAGTGLACPAADSAVLSFNADIASTIAGGDGRNIVQAVHDVVWALRDRATSMGMEGVVFAAVMRKEAFRALTETWACNYATYRCSSTNAGQPFTNDVMNTNALRLEMAEGQYLLVDNVPLPVVFSEGVPQDSLGSNIFKSDIYIVPISWNGLPLLRMEYFDMDNEHLQEFANYGDMDKFTTLNNGMYLMSYRFTPMCLEYHFAAKWRTILETPFLAGRVDDVRYTFRAPIRNAQPGDTWFHADGGISIRQ